MATTAVLHSEWIKMTSIRSQFGSLLAILLATAGISALAGAAFGQAEADNADFDPIFGAFYGLNFGQIAAISFGVTVFSSEYHHDAIRVSLTAVPRRGLLYSSKMTVVGGSALVLGLVTGFTTFLAVQAFMGEYAIGLADPGALRAAVGSGIYLALMALFAAGLTAVLRSGVAVLSLLVPFVLIVSFVIGDVAQGVAVYLPDRAGQLVVHQDPQGSLGPWAGLGVTALWAGAAVLAGWFTMKRRDA
ncbi:ABC transporter permease [Streptomyces sp. SYSU K217416]